MLVAPTEIFVQGIGAVSPAGWGINFFRDAMAKKIPIPPKDLVRPGWEKSLRVRSVPDLQPRPDFFLHARLRRTSPITQYAVAAGIEALGSDAFAVNKGEMRLGIILCVMSGCVNYSKRFYDETLRDPATASPLVFPETVFNAPASHLASLLGTTAISYTLIGDPGTFLQGLALAADWLLSERVEGCLVIGAEEIDWLTSDAFRLFQKQIFLSAGAGAVYLRRESILTSTIKLNAVTDSHLFLKKQPRSLAIKKMRAEISNRSATKTILCDSTQQIPRLDADELNAWKDWVGARLSIKNILGEGLMAASAWQCVAAIDALQQKLFETANVSVVGTNQQAIGAQFCGEVSP